MSRNLIDRLYLIFNSFIGCLFVLFSGIIFSFSYQFYIHMNCDELNGVVLKKQSIVIILLVAVCICSLIGIRRMLRRIKPTVLFCMGSLIYVLIGILLVFFADSKINDDPAIVFRYLEKFLSGDFQGITKGYYFSYAPGNLGLLTYEIPFYLVFKGTRLLFAANLLWVMISEYSMWKITQILYKDDWLIQNYVIIFEFGFIPMLFHIMRIYGQIPGAAFFSYAMLLGIRLYTSEKKSKKKSVMLIISIILLTGLACMVRANYTIASIAFLIASFLISMRRKQIGVLLLGCAVFIGSIAIPAGVRDLYRVIGQENFDTGVPFSCYLYMGSSPNYNNRLLDGWFDGYNWDTYAANEFDTVKADKVCKEDLRILVNKYRKDSGLLREVYCHKMITTWSEPTFQSVCTGPAEYSNGLNNRTAVLESLYSGDYAYMVYELMSRIVVLIFYFLWFVGGLIYLYNIWKKREQGVIDEMQFFILHFIGTYIFHMFWETNASYVFVSVFWMIMFAAWSMVEISKGIDTIILAKQNRMKVN